jgi:Sulfotransferase family
VGELNMVSPVRKPNFFIVGAPKAGTTSLYHYLDQHPDIYMSPIKEPCFFSSETRPENFEASLRPRAVRLEEDILRYLHGPMDTKRFGGIVREWQHYLLLFANAAAQRAVGEASVNYLWSKTAPGAIAARIPRARILVVLRSPAERAFSQYLHCVTGGVVTESFRDFVRSSLRYQGEELGIHKPFLEMGFYAEQVLRYLDHFPREQLGIWLYEETKQRPREFLRDVLQFLDVDSSFVPDVTNRYNEPLVARMVKSTQMLRRTGVWGVVKRLTPKRIRFAMRGAIFRPPGSVRMEPQDKAMMLDFYRTDIHRLEEILGRNLSAWLA